MTHEELVAKAREALENVMEDTTVPALQTKQDLIELRAEIQSMIESIGE